MVQSGHVFDRRVAAALAMMALMPLARAHDGPAPRPVTVSAPLEIPHVVNRTLTEKAHKAQDKSVATASYDFSLLNYNLQPLQWPSNSDALRASLLTPQLKSTPVVGWLAENLYRDKADNGWCVQLDGGEYVVLYRYHPKK
jgi:hypothetical protein